MSDAKSHIVPQKPRLVFCQQSGLYICSQDQTTSRQTHTGPDVTSSQTPTNTRRVTLPVPLGDVDTAGGSQ
ncbi:hypothetical protein E2C01_006534 [Portunus trituberculatus]|uniref:Uncharacterized protein n=1 Tax=Portunus trituberculatus TaxID=210409 RepID=A0A5B7CWI8_PORTR|nr:hypothetical protein [Portunus trituberculatus]